MIFILAADLDDARQWARFNGEPATAWHYVGQRRTFQADRPLTERDRIVRTARRLEHSDAFALVVELERALARARLTETAEGRLVRQVA